MAIYAILATKAGNNALARYDGANDEMSFIQAMILARASDETITMTGIIHYLNEEYPTLLGDGIVSGAITKLESLGFIQIIREISDDTRITVVIEGFAISTKVGDFLKRNLATRMPKHLLDAALEQLKWKGAISVTHPVSRKTALIKLQ